MAKRIYVGNLPYKAEAADVRGYFRGNAHLVGDIDIRRHEPSASSSARLSVDDDAVERVVAALNGLSVGGNTLVAGTDQSIVINHEEQW